VKGESQRRSGVSAKAFRGGGLLAAALLFLGAAGAGAEETAANRAAFLVARYESLRSPLGQNPYGRPLHLESSEVSGAVAGDVYALVDHPFATTQAALNVPDRWCDILILHINTKYCSASMAGPVSVLRIGLGKKDERSPDQAYGVDLSYHVVADTPSYLQVRLDADHGPLSTRDYRIVLEAIPLSGGRTFLHFRFSNAYGLAGRLALQAYLATIGSSKVGFTVVGRHSDGKPQYVGGLRGVVERNSMRYYLAVESFLGALSSPPAEQTEKRLRDWFMAVEGYPVQLHEMQQAEYLDMKRREILRQQAELGGYAKIAARP
jgi:hypothetical protein